MHTSLHTPINPIDEDCLADIEFCIGWQSPEGKHTDTVLLMANFWRDLLPEKIRKGLWGARSGDCLSFSFSPGELLPPFDPGNRYCVKRGDFNEQATRPAFGRFYPKGILRGIPNVFPQNMAPVRCIGVDDETVRVDLNHPLAAHDIQLTALVHGVYRKPFDRGGQSRELAESIASGPGMQARFDGKPTDFFYDGAFLRADEADDAAFYSNARLVTHLDDRAIQTIGERYAGILSPGMSVLDLMSSWRSHVPADAAPKHMTGLGMNAEEMEENPQLNDFVVHDLNRDPRLPFSDGAFDAVLCTASVEYLIHPVAVFRETARTLRPGGIFINTFSNRWFPTKTIRLWTELHEFERMGLIMEYYLRSGTFTELSTCSARGWDRPESDRYYPEKMQSDPVYAVWGRKK